MTSVGDMRHRRLHTHSPPLLHIRGVNIVILSKRLTLWSVGSLRRQELVKVEKADAMERWVAMAAGVRLPIEITFEEKRFVHGVRFSSRDLSGSALLNQICSPCQYHNVTWNWARNILLPF